MELLRKVNPFQTNIENTKFGILTTLNAKTELSAKNSISHGSKSLLANYIYKKDETYNLVYTIIDKDGKEQSFVENDGILPTLFLSPDQENHVSVVPYHPDKELEICIPVFNRENIKPPKGNRPFTADFIGTSNQFSIFYDVDFWSDKKPDKLLAIEFKNGLIKKKHNIKVPLPRNNKVFISNNELHLLSKENNNWLHRQIDEKGNEIKQRQFETNQSFYREILYLSFNKNSFLLNEEDGKITIDKIDAQGNCNSIDLFDIGDPFYNTWRPVKIAKDTFVTMFNGEFGNGWLTTKDDQLLEIFYSKGDNGYKNLLTNEVFEMPIKDLIISSINSTSENAYSVVFYPRTDDSIKNDKLFILGRDLN